MAGWTHLSIHASECSDLLAVIFSLLALTSIVSSFAAGTIFRPDNQQVMALLPQCVSGHWPDTKSKTKTHGYLNVVAVLSAVIVIGLKSIPGRH